MASAHVQQPSATPQSFKISPLSTNAVQADANAQTASPTSPPRPRSMLDIGLEAVAKTPKKRSDSGLSTPSPTSPVAMLPTSSPKPASILSDPRPTPEQQLRSRPVSTSTTTSIASTIPRSTPEEVQHEKPAPLERKISERINGSPATPASSERPKLLSRMGSMLKRTKSGNNNNLVPVESNDSSRASTTSTPEKSAPQKTFTFSSRSSATSRSATPPSPASPSSTIFKHESEHTPDTNPNLRRNSHSHSSHALSSRSGIRQGITWGPNVEGGLRPPLSPNRRRSASTEQVPMIRKPGPKCVHEDEDGEVVTVPLIAAFSKDAPEGAGLKARRLSTALPSEFIVDYCELDKEFVSSSKIPFRRGKAVGEGATATVRLMFRRGDASHIIYAVKEFRGRDKREDSEEDYRKKIMGEYTIAKSLHHPNIVDTIRLCNHHGRWDHVMEYCAHGELFQYVSKRLFQTYWTLKDQQCFFKQLVRAVNYLHSHGIAHRDIKLENLLLTSEGCLKLTDFGVADVFSGEHPGLRAAGGECGKNMGEVRRCKPGILGSLPYMAPEVLAKKGDYDPRGLDVWSCAVVYLTMTYGGNPWPAANEQNTYYLRFRNGYEKWTKENPDCIITDTNYPVCGPLFKSSERLGGPAMKRLMLKMMNPNPDKRISIHDVLLSNTVKGIECCTDESYEDSPTCCVDASKGKATTTDGKKTKLQVKKKHNHVPPKEHKTPKVFQHRFDMGDGYS